MAQGRDPRIVIIGAGMSGIAVAHVLKQSGFSQFTILEKGSDVGGVWHWNRYPGLRCDVPSYGYQFAFAPKPDWSHVWATGDEIQRYHHELVDKLELRSHLRLDCEVTEALFADNQWRVRTADGDDIEADFLIAATGVLHHPFIPDIPGLDSFTGPIVHTARWTDIDIRGKRGRSHWRRFYWGASLFDATARRGAHHAFRPHAAVGDVDADADAAATLRQPDTADAAEAGQDGSSVTVHRLRLPCRPGHPAHLAAPRGPALRVDVLASPGARQDSSRQAGVRLPTVLQTAGALRRLLPANRQAQFQLRQRTDRRDHCDGRPMTLRGRDGLSIDDAWAKGPRAWVMTAIPGSPNLFLVLGPNSPTGSISLQHVAELTARYITRWLNRFRDGEIAGVEVAEEATDRFADEVAEAMVPTVWNTGCNSWYFSDDNHIDLWPFDRKRLTRMLTRPKDDDYILT